MNENQIGGLLVILLGALPCFAIAIYTLKTRSYHLFTVWDPSKIANEDAYGKMLCKGVISCSLLIAVAGILMVANILNNEMVALGAVFFAIVPLFYYMNKAKRLYGK